MRIVIAILLILIVFIGCADRLKSIVKADDMTMQTEAFEARYSKNDYVATNIKSNELLYVNPFEKYILCKRSLSFSSDKGIFIKPLSSLGISNAAHLHFFKYNLYKAYILETNSVVIGEMYRYSMFSNFFLSSLYQHPLKLPSYSRHMTIDENCYKNGFSNFGLMGNSQISCSEDLSQYEACTQDPFHGNILAALDNLMQDSQYLEYKLFNYNCQTFAKHILELMRKVGHGNTAMCFKCDNCGTNIFDFKSLENWKFKELKHSF